MEFSQCFLFVFPPVTSWSLVVFDLQDLLGKPSVAKWQDVLLASH